MFFFPISRFSSFPSLDGAAILLYICPSKPPPPWFFSAPVILTDPFRGTFPSIYPPRMMIWFPPPPFVSPFGCLLCSPDPRRLGLQGLVPLYFPKNRNIFCRFFFFTAPFFPLPSPVRLLQSETAELGSLGIPPDSCVIFSVLSPFAAGFDQIDRLLPLFVLLHDNPEPALPNPRFMKLCGPRKNQAFFFDESTELDGVCEIFSF